MGERGFIGERGFMGERGIDCNSPPKEGWRKAPG